MNITELKDRLKQAIPPTLVTLVIFFALLKWFSIKNAILALTMAMLFVKMIAEPPEKRQWVLTLLINLMVAAFAYLATLNRITLVIVDLIIPFFLIYLLMDSDASKEYFSYGLVFVLLQSFSIPLKEMPLRFAAIIFSYGLMSLGVIVFSKKIHGEKNKNPLYFSQRLKTLQKKISLFFKRIKLLLIQMKRILKGLFRSEKMREEDGFYYRKMRFALRLSILVTFSFFIEKTFHIPKGYWLPMNVFIMIQPYYEDSVEKIKGRVWGNLLGILICFVLFYFIKDLQGHLIILSLATFLRYLVKKYLFLATAMTCYALSLGSLFMDLDKLFELRIAYVLLAGVLAFIGSRLIFENPKNKEIL